MTAGLTVLLVAVFISLIQLTCKTPDDFERIIQESSGLREHDKFCLSLPQPIDFKLKYKTVGGNSFTTAISYHVWTDQTFEQLKDFYRDRYESDGWEMTGLEEDERYRRPKYMSFRKGNFRIAIERVGNQTSNYSFYCARED